MTVQYSTTHRTNAATDIVTQAGATAYLLIYSGAAPANCAAAATGTLLASLPMSATIGTVASGVLTMNAITAAAAAAAGTAGYWRICTTSAGTTCVAQGTVFGQVSLATSATTAANSNVLTFASGATAFTAGMAISGTGIPAGTTVLASTATTVTMSQASTAGVGSAVTITGGGDLTFTGGTAFTVGETISVSSFTITTAGA